MILVISAEKPALEAQFDARFGRCACFIVVDSDTGNWQALENPAIGSAGGAGTMASQFISELGASAVISGHFGPKAYRALKSAGIDMYNAGDNLVKEVLDKFQAGLLEQVRAPSEYGGRGGRRNLQRSG